MDEVFETDTEVHDRWIDQVVDGRYRVLERIGRGGMGVVYRVEHTRMGKIAAMKLLHANLVSDRELLRRFRAEAEAISKLTHPNIVQVFDFGQADETAYLVMEYLKGEDLGAIIRRDGALDLGRAAAIISQICDALTEAHEIGIIHRDLKPENIRVSRTRDGQDFVKVLDFGLAKMIENEQQASVTAQGSLVGTPYYMAPEQIRAEKVDQRSDIYSLGALLYHMLTGKQAFAAKTPMGVLTRHITEEVVPPSHSVPELGLTPDVDALVTRTLAKQPDERFGSALELKHALVAVAASSPSGEVSLLAGQPPGGAASPAFRRATDQDRSLVADDLGYLSTSQMDSPLVTSGARLAREDLAFERRLRHGRLLKLLLVLVAVLAAGGGATYYALFVRSQPLLAPPEEREPNNEPQQATLLARGKTVLGHLGSRVSATESDRDWYRVQVDAKDNQILAAQVDGIPNMDITLELYDAIGGRVYTADSTAVGGGERITNHPVGPGKHFILVRERWRVGARPTENVTDSYRLSARWAPAEPGWEIEPNDGPRQATALRAGERVRGYLGGVADRDRFAITAKRAGRLAGEISAIADVDIVLELSHGGARVRRIDTAKAGKGEAFSGIAIEAGAQLQLSVRRKQTKRTESAEPPGLTRPYTLKTWLE